MLDTKREYTVRAPAHLRVCAGVEDLAALLALEAGAVPVVAQGLPPLREVDRSPALPTRPHPHTRQPLTRHREIVTLSAVTHSLLETVTITWVSSPGPCGHLCKGVNFKRSNRRVIK